MMTNEVITVQVFKLFLWAGCMWLMTGRSAGRGEALVNTNIPSCSVGVGKFIECVLECLALRVMHHRVLTV